MRCRILCLSLLVWASIAVAMDPVDSAQSHAMIDFLDNCHAGTVPPSAIEQVMALPGTQLLIAQQNISRRITPAQYRATLVSACKGDIARLQPSEAGARAEKGMEGLT